MQGDHRGDISFHSQVFDELKDLQLVLKVEKLAHGGLKDVSLSVRQGEILGLVGVAGNGQKPLVEVISGLEKPPKGTVQLLGQEWRRFFAKRKWKNGLSYIPEDRQGLATCQGLDLLDNFLLTTRNGFKKSIWLMRGEAKEKAEKLIHEFDIRPPDLSALAWQLSGGYRVNQNFSVELAFADLGGAEILSLGTAVGDLQYRQTSLSVLWSPTMKPDRTWRPYLKAGINYSDPSWDNDPLIVDDWGALAGIGIEKFLRNNRFALRVEYTAYAKDAELLSLSMVMYFSD